MRKTLLMWLTLMLSISGWAAHTVTVSTSDSDAGHVEIQISGNGDVDGETYHDTYEYGDYAEFEVANKRKLTLMAVVEDESVYQFTGWSDGSKANPHPTVTVTGPYEITANFEVIPTYFVYANAQPAVAVDQISVSASESVDEGDGYAEVYEGTTVTMEIDPSYITAGYRFVGWYDGEEIISSDYSCQVTSGAADKTYTAKFEEIPTFTITVEKNIDGGEASVWLYSGEEADGDDDFGSWITVNENSEVYLYAVASEGYRFLGWFIGDEMVYGPESEYQEKHFIPTKDETYTAKFELIPTYTITVEKNIEDAGDAWVDLHSGKMVAQDEDGYSWMTVQENSEVYVEAMTHSGYRFLGFYVGEEKVYGIEDLSHYVYGDEYYYYFTFVPTEDITYTAKFELIPTYTITVEKNIEDAGDAEVGFRSGKMVAQDEDYYSWITVQENSEVYLYAVASEGYRFLGWYDGEEQIYGPEYNNQNIEFTPTESKTYTAKFEEIPKYTITVEKNIEDAGYAEVGFHSGKMIALDEDYNSWMTVQENSEVYLYANADEGYRFLGWYDGEEQIYGPEYNNKDIYFTPTESKTYTAKFELIPVYTISVSTQPTGIFEEESYGIYVQKNSTGEQSESSFGIQEGTTFDIYAAPNGYDLYSHLKFDHWESDKGGYAGTLNIINNLESLEDEHWTAVYIPNFGGYTQVGTTNLYSKENTDGEATLIDIKGMSDNKYYSSTYSDYGYQAAIKINGETYSVLNGMDIYGIQVTTSVLQSGAMARIVYRVSNTGSEDAVISLGTHADVKIGSNDEAPIEAIRDDNNKTIGIKMQDGEGGQLYVIFGLGAAGSTLIDDYWFGAFGENSSGNEMIGNYTIKNPEYYMVENGSYDSGMGWCWKNRTIAAGQTVMYSFMVGIGEVKMEPSASVILTPLDLSTWNDLSATHSMYAEGIYTHTTGVDGYLEYQVESTDADGWTTLATDPERLASDADFHGTFEAKFDASKAVHTIHFRTRDILGNITSLPSQQFEDLSDYTIEGEIVDKTYNGEAQTQDVLLPGIEAGKYTVSYQNNINAGTATVVLAGSFPHTIGFKQFNFTINPRPLVGTIVFNTSGFVYDGYAHKPSWTLDNYSLVENKDYTATWSKNILPGTASLTITGKGNYSGSLNANFVIDKATVDANMYTVKLPANALYDGEQHVAVFTKKNSEIGDASFFYYNNSTLQNPIDKGEYAVRLEIEENALYHGFTTYVGSFNIWRMDPEEWAALQAIYAELSTRSWANPWDMSKGEAEAGNFAGLTFKEGHITALNLSNNGIDGNFPLSTLNLPYMTSLNLSNNNIGGNIENGLGATEIAALNTLSKLQTLNIANNELEGNIGIFAQALPKLISLNAANNHIADVVPMLSTAITSLNLNSQVILGTRVIDLPTVAGDYEALLPIFPSIMLYNHDAQNYLPESNSIVTVKDDLNNPHFEAGVVVTDWVNREWDFACAGNTNVFNYSTDDEFFVTKENSASRFTVKFNFNDGDANFNGVTDVLDLQATINFIFGEYSSQRPFNFTAANLFKDETVNVQDIVLMTDLLLAEEEPQPAPRRVKAVEPDEQAMAELRWENGELHLTSQIPVAALDLVISASAEIEWLIPTHSVVTKETVKGHHAVIYSIAGNTLAQNGDVVIARSNDLAPVTLKAVLADSDAMPISVRRITVDAKVPTGTENAQDDSVRSMKVMRDGVLYIERGGNTYDATGRLIKK